MFFTTEEKVWWIKKYYHTGRSLRNVCDAFAAEFPERPKPSPSTIMRCVQRFQRTGNVEFDRTKIRHGRAERPEHVLVLAAVTAKPSISLREIEHQGGPPKSTSGRILKRHHYRSYHVNVHQALRTGDTERRFQFAATALEMQEADPDFFSRIIFTDESTFTCHNTPNRQDTRVWSQGNPHALYCGHTQYPQKVNVWAGMVNSQILGPIFLDGSLSGERYLQLLQNEVSDLLEDLFLPPNLWYMHDGCPAHNYRLAREFLHNSFAGQVIGTHTTPLGWPARSPDLNPCDTFLWGHITTQIYRTTPFQNVEALQGAIERCCDALSPLQLGNVLSDFEDRLGYCVAAEGGLFEHLL